MDPTAEGIRKLLSGHGYPFQYAVLRRIEQLFGEGRSSWALEVAEFPVGSPDNVLHIDFVLKAKSSSVYLVGECKRADPARANWCFVEAPYTRRNADGKELVFQGVKYQPANLVESLARTKVGVSTTNVGHLGFELRTGVQGDGRGGRAAINEATAQVLRALNGLVDQLFPGAATVVQEKGAALFLPVIFTTASLWMARGDLSDADLRTGGLPEQWGTLEHVPWVWFNYNQSPALRHRLGPTIQSGFDISKALLSEYTRTIAVVGPDGLDDFLARDLATWLL